MKISETAHAPVACCVLGTMRTLLAALTAATLTAVAGPAAAQTAAPRPAQRIEVVGQGSVDRMPDRVAVTFAIITNDDTASKATTDNNIVFNALLAKMQALGLNTGAIRTTNYMINYNARPAQPNPQFPQRYGYIVTRNVTVTSDSTERAGAIVDGGVAAGVTNVAGVVFTIRDARGAYRAAQTAAVADAQAQAEGLAAAAHLHVVRLASISAGASTSVPRPVFFSNAVALRAAPPPPVPTDVEASSLTVNATVTAVYEVAP